MSNILDILLYPFIWRPLKRNYTMSLSTSSPEADSYAGIIQEAGGEPEIDQTEWSPVKLTLVEYPKDDTVGFVYAAASLAPLVIIVGLLTLILFRRDLWTITFFSNLMLDELLNKLLKNMIKSPRPMERKDAYGKYGMPSSHAQFMGFFTAYLILFICLRQHQTYRNFFGKVVRNLLVMMLVVVNIIVCLSRVYLSYHTLLQVCVGQGIGITLGSLMFFGVTHFVAPLFPAIVSWKISEFLLIRDTNVIPNVLLFEYVIIRQETRARLRQTKNKKSIQ
ncbi:DOLPP1 family protein [Megaselia abdita]